jgi:hypothetical protein
LQKALTSQVFPAGRLWLWLAIFLEQGRLQRGKGGM